MNSLDKDQIRAPDMDHVTGRQLPVRVEWLVIDARAVEAIEIADMPPAVTPGHLGVLARAQVVFQYDSIGRRATESVRLAGLERENVAEAVIAPDNEIGCRS
jgi:hypothetical protein